jgi:tRNA pseudouridine38-40 synthase
MRYFLQISYDGSNFLGWQMQASGRTVQQEINKVLSIIAREHINVVGCGRTDTGVHAAQFFLHFDTAFQFHDGLLHKINHMLPEDIAAHRIIPVHDNAHARFDAVWRTYEYRIHFQKNPLLRKFSTYKYGGKPDFCLMQEAAERLLNYKDFWPVCRESHDAKTTLCVLRQSCWRQEKDEWIYTITANRFLRNMVRLTVAVLLSIGYGKRSMEEFIDTFEQRGRFKYLKAAPPQGLILTEVQYPYID